MIKYNRAWESTVFGMAQQGLEHEALPTPLDGYPGLDAAYAACDEIASQHSQTFYTASRPLPAEKRRAIRSLYAFCRITDDLIDRVGRQPGRWAGRVARVRGLLAAPLR